MSAASWARKSGPPAAADRLAIEFVDRSAKGRALSESPVLPDEAFALLNDNLPPAARRIVLAVSGGPDSLALLAFAAESRLQLGARGREFLVVVVDHGLRAEAAEEARSVVRLAAAFGVSSRIMNWTRGEARGNLSALARSGRYALLLEAARDFGASVVVTAHHEDDQIETHVMAAERGEGIVRLAGMRRCRDLAPGIRLCRPLLGVAKARLEASLRARGIAWSDDPSNHDVRLHRARIRAELVVVSRPERIELLRRIRQAGEQRDDLDRKVSALLPHVAVDLAGALRFDRDLVVHEDGVGQVLLSRVLAAAGGSAGSASRREIDRLCAQLAGGLSQAVTLGGCRIVNAGAQVEVFREFGRFGPPALDLAERAFPCFDERFDLVSPLPSSARLIVALGTFGRGGMRRSTLPVVLDGEGRVIAAHHATGLPQDDGVTPCDFTERVSWRLRRDTR